MCAKSQADKSNYEDCFGSVRVHLPRTNCKIKEIKYVQILNPEPLDRVAMKEKNSVYMVAFLTSKSWLCSIYFTLAHLQLPFKEILREGHNCLAL